MAICTVTGTITTLDETPVVGQEVVATVRLTHADQGGQVATIEGVVVPVRVGVTSEPIVAYTDDDGCFEIDLVQGAIVLLEISAINLRKEILVPASDEVDFISLI